MKKRQKIAVDARFLIEGKLEGIGIYSHEVLSRLVQLMPETEFHFLFDRKPSNSFIYSENVKSHEIFPPARHPFLWYWWYEISLKNWFRKNKVDAFFSPTSFLSLNCNAPTLLTMHDIAFEHFDDHNSFLVRKYYQHYFPKYAQKASTILTVSEFTKSDIRNTYRIEEDKIKVAYCGVSEKYFPISAEQKKQIKLKYANGNRYFIAIGSINPRKNLDAIIKAFEIFKQKNNPEHKLIIVGAKGWKTGLFFKAIENSSYKNDIILTGHLAPEKLNLVLGGATALIFTSLFEGFGIPIVEAFKAEIPVITSNVSSMPEVAKDAAVLVNPKDTDAIADAMQKIQEDNLRTKLIEKGITRAKDFNWDRTAEKVKIELEHFL